MFVTAAPPRSARDEDTYNAAAAQGRVVVMEDASDCARMLRQTLDAGAPIVPVVVDHKNRLPRGGAMLLGLADALVRWSLENPSPHPRAHWR